MRNKIELSEVRSGPNPLPAGGWGRYRVALVASEVSTLTRYYDRGIQWLRRDADSGLLLSQIDCPEKCEIAQEEPFPDLTGEVDRRTAILINGTFNHHFDIQAALAELKPKLARTARIVLVLYNPYLRLVYRLANRLGLRRGEVPSTFVTLADLHNLAVLK